MIEKYYLIIGVVVLAGLAVVMLSKKKKGEKQVAEYGFQIFDKNGKVLFDSNDRLAKFVGVKSLNGTDGYITVPEGGSLFYFLQGASDYNQMHYPIITIDGRTIRYRYLNKPVPYKGNLFYGVF